MDKLAEQISTSITTGRVLQDQQAADRHDELVKQNKEIIDMLKSIKELLGDNAKRVSKPKDKKTEDPPAAMPAATTAKPKEKAVAEKVVGKKSSNFPTSARAWFMQNYLASEEFRLKYSNKDMDDAAATSDAVKKAKAAGLAEDELNTKIANAKWLRCCSEKHKDTCGELKKKIHDDFEAAKSSQGAAPNVPQTAEEFDDE